MLFFLPDWEDRVDPDYDFMEDKHSREKSQSYQKDVYAHQLFSSPPYDGLLVSLSVFKNKIRLNHRSEVRGLSSIREYLKVPKSSSLRIMGDCGAFSYVKEKVPPEDFGIDKVADLYASLRFDWGVSTDHLIPDSLELSEKEFRRTLTLQNAREFIRYHAKKGYAFEPVGAVQGYCPDSYEESAVKTVEMGYKVIGIGSLVQRSDEELLSIARKVIRALKGKKVHVHLFGVLRLKVLKELRSLGIGSFDSASFLRKAWLRTGRNYLTKEGTWYSAIRIPYSDNPDLLKSALQKGYGLKDVKELEERALYAVREYAKGKARLEDTLKAVLEYDSLLTRKFDRNDNYEQYKKTLSEKPWELCDCEICRKVGVEVIIFRGANRNKRRGLHNIKVFYDWFLNRGSNEGKSSSPTDCR
ncbi:MAG: tRNA-guanine transglycosylase DpdA [Aquificaceae bacterium]|nr:tRNA-guanine transglycosylase DpdA [Aquificaceae bacterium]